MPRVHWNEIELLFMTYRYYIDILTIYNNKIEQFYFSDEKLGLKDLTKSASSQLTICNSISSAQFKCYPCSCVFISKMNFIF